MLCPPHQREGESVFSHSTPVGVVCPGVPNMGFSWDCSTSRLLLLPSSQLLAEHRCCQQLHCTLHTFPLFWVTAAEQQMLQVWQPGQACIGHLQSRFLAELSKLPKPEKSGMGSLREWLT